MTLIAACQKCFSRNMVFLGSSIDGVRSYRFRCYECGDETPEREKMVQADEDVSWVTATAPVATAQVNAWAQ